MEEQHSKRPQIEGDTCRVCSQLGDVDHACCLICRQEKQLRHLGRAVTRRRHLGAKHLANCARDIQIDQPPCAAKKYSVQRLQVGVDPPSGMQMAERECDIVRDLTNQKEIFTHEMVVADCIIKAALSKIEHKQKAIAHSSTVVMQHRLPGQLSREAVYSLHISMQRTCLTEGGLVDQRIHIHGAHGHNKRCQVGPPLKLGKQLA
eukprot:3884666-Prymnesium_polylepis.2